MSERGFTLVELLVASAISLVIAAGALLLSGAARTAMAVEPASIDTVRRLREGADVIAAAVASAGGARDIGNDRGSLAASVPVLRLLAAESGSVFGGLSVIRAVNGGRGQLVEDQPGPAGSLMLDVSDGLCPRSGIVCGFMEGDVAVVFDGRGHFDVMIVGAVSEALARITPRAPLAFAYRAGAWVVAVRHERLLLLRQADGGQTLTRLTAAGAREPVLDGVTRLEMDAWGRAAPPGLYEPPTGPGVAQYGLSPLAADDPDPEGIFAEGSHCMAVRVEGLLQTTVIARDPEEGGLARLSPADLDDGPWCPHEAAPGRFDADWFRLRRVDLRLQVEVLSAEFRGPAGVLFARAGSATHDAPRWVRDRTISISVAVGR